MDITMFFSIIMAVSIACVVWLIIVNEYYIRTNNELEVRISVLQQDNIRLTDEIEIMLDNSQKLRAKIEELESERTKKVNKKTMRKEELTETQTTLLMTV